MSRTKGARARSGRRLAGLALALAAAIVAGVAAYRYCNTAAGGAMLLDLGVEGRFAAVQRDLGTRIAAAAVRAGVPPEALRVEASSGAGAGGGQAALVTGQVPAGRSLVQVNAAVDKAVRGGGGRVRVCMEAPGGGAIEMEIGTRRRVTHRCVFRRPGRTAARPEPAPPARPMIALVVDDFGYFNNRVVRDFLALEIPLTISIIPGLRHSEAIAARAREAGKETICHLPMEPEDDPGGDTPLVRVDMSREQIESAVERALETTPGVVGMNNHMGSRATADRPVMEAVLAVCRRRGLFFFDSFTTARSVVAETAAAAGVPSLRSDFFLDNRGDDVRANMSAMLSQAARKGRATGILHVRRENLAHLRWLASEAEKEGVAIVTLSHLLGS